MQHTLFRLRKATIALLLFALVAALSPQLISAETGLYDGHDCVIPDSGPWPPCATGGGSGAAPAPAGGDCVIPDSGPWPPCATDGSGSGAAPAPSGGDCVIPDSGPWPPCATDGSGGGSTPAPAPSGDCVIPESGPWPPCANGGGGSAPAPAAPAPISNAQIDARINLAIDQVQDFWIQSFREMGKSYRPPSIVTTYEGDPNDPPNAFYVPAMDAIFVDMRLLREVTAAYGEYAAVSVLAHEWGHFAQDLLNLFGNRPLRRIELQADCFSGNFTKYLQNIGQLKPGEYESARQLFYSIGDDIIAPDAPYDTPGAHGTALERQAAFEYGWEKPVLNCVNDYE